jgi:tetratricopeptide (TPR) repeat protein
MWQFRHPLVQETVYASLLSATRTTLHRTAGHALEALSDALVPDRLALLALHFGRGDDRQRAVKYLSAAGDRARALYLNREAIRYYEDALSRLGNSGEEQAVRATVLAAKAAGLEVLAEDAAALDSLRAAIDLEQRASVRSALQVRMAEIHRRRGTYALAREELVHAEATLRRKGDPVQRARVRISHSMLAWECGSFTEARRLGEEALTLIGERDAPREEAAAWRAIGIAAARDRDLAGAYAALTRGQAAAQRGRDAFTAATIGGNLGAVLQLQGRYAEARALYEDSLAFYERIGAKRQMVSVWINLGELAWRAGDGDWATARGQWSRAAWLADEIGDRRNLALAVMNLAEGHVSRGDLAEAVTYLERAQQLARELGDAELERTSERLLAQARLS